LITFTCKDALLAKHYDEVFRGLFEDHLSWTPVKSLPELRLFMDECMTAEARFQEHYDFTTDGKLRTPIYDSDGTPKLLIPEIEVI
jgi:hypothetical protein